MNLNGYYYPAMKRPWFINVHILLPKTYFMTIGTRQNLQNTDLIESYLNNEILQTTCTQKCLGVIIDKTLSWKSRIDSVCLNIAPRIPLIKQLSKYVCK